MKKRTRAEKYVAAARSTRGQGMIVKDDGGGTCELYELALSDKAERHPHLIYEIICGEAKARFGNITERYVIRRRKTRDEGSTHYLNVEEYLRTLQSRA